MEMDLKPKKAQPMLEGDGGVYSIWSSSQVPLLTKNNVAAGCVKLQPRVLALPHYSDSDKIGLVIQGTDGVAGMVMPNAEKEVVLRLKKGDVIPVPFGVVSWWLNNGDSELIVLFLSETSQAHVPGQVTYFLLTGTQGVISGLSSEVITKAHNLTNKEAHKLTKSQQETFFLNLKKGHYNKMPEPDMDMTKKMVYNIDDAKPDHGGVKNGVLVKTLTESEFPFVGEVGLSVMKVKLEANAIKAPVYSMNPAVQVIYVARGNGKIEIVGLNGKSVLNSQVEAGDLIVVPKCFVIAELAGNDGIEFYSMLNTKGPVFEELAGKASIWKKISPQVLELALNVDPDFVHTTNLIPSFD